MSQNPQAIAGGGARCKRSPSEAFLKIKHSRNNQIDTFEIRQFAKRGVKSINVTVTLGPESVCCDAMSSRDRKVADILTGPKYQHEPLCT